MIYPAAIFEDVPVTEPDEIARLRCRDSAALASVVGRYQHRLYRYLRRLVREPAAADDLFQQTWLNVVRQMDRYDSRRSFDTWLFAIAHNAAMDLLRRQTGESLEESEHKLAAAEPDALSAPWHRSAQPSWPRKWRGFPRPTGKFSPCGLKKA